MNIPKEIKIGGHTIKVFFCNFRNNKQPWGIQHLSSPNQIKKRR